MDGVALHPLHCYKETTDKNNEPQMITYEHEIDYAYEIVKNSNFDCVVASDLYATSGFTPVDIERFFDEIYPTELNQEQLIKEENKECFPYVLHSFLYDNNVGRTSTNIKRWNGLYILDIDFEKPYKYQNKYLNSIYADVKMIGNWCIENQITFKNSSSGKGIHVLLLVNVFKHYSDEETLELRKKVYGYLNEKFSSKLDSLDLKHRDLWKIDENYISNKTLGVTFAPSVRYANFLHYELDKRILQDIIDTYQLPIKSYSSDGKVLVDDISLEDKDKLKQAVLTLPNFNPCWKNDASPQIMNALIYIGMDKHEAVNFMFGKSSNCGRSSLNSIYDWATRNQNNPLVRTSWKFLIKEINNYSSKKINLQIKQKETLKSENELRVKKYCSERKDELFKLFDANNKVLFKAPTGSGKSTLMIEYVKCYHIQNPSDVIAIACDTITLAEQIADEYDLPILSSNKKHINHCSHVNSKGIYITTYDSLNKFERVDCLFIDEAHLLTNGVSYRPKALSYLKGLMAEVKKTIAVTATPDYLFPLLHEYELVSVEAEDTIVNQHILLKSKIGKGKKVKKLNKIISHIKKNPLQGKCVIYLNNIQKIKELKQRLDEEMPGMYRSEIYYSGGANIGLDEIQKDKLIPTDIDIIITTSILQNGVNIWNKDIDRCYTDEIEKTSLKQFESRFREGGVTIYLLVEDSESTSKPLLNGYSDWASYCKKSSIVCSNFNKLSELYETERKLYKPEKVIEYSYNYVSGQYEVDEYGCAYKVYDSNRRYYAVYPKNIGCDFTEEIVQDISDLGVEKTIKVESTEAIKRLESFFYRKGNTEKILINFHQNPELTRKKNNSFQDYYSIEYKFFQRYKDIILSNEKSLRKKVLGVKEYMDSFNLTIDNASNIYKEEPSLKNVARGFYFNYLQNINQSNKEIIIRSLPLQEIPKYELFNQLKELFPIGVYSFEEIKYKLQQLRNTKEYERYTRYSFSNDKHIMQLLRICYSVKSKQVSTDGVRPRKIFLSNYKPHRLLKSYQKALNLNSALNELAQWLCD